MMDVEPMNTEWLWKQRVPYGAITILDGDPNIGKSTISNDLAARVSTGRQMPGGKLVGKRKTRNSKGNVLLLSAEDDPHRTIRPRLEAAGADLRRIRLFMHVDDVECGERRIIMPRDIPTLE
jgi:RecA-family ATPase